MSHIPIVMKVWAGDSEHDLRYVMRSIPSLLKSELPENIKINIFDDCSPNHRLQAFLREVSRRDKRVRLFRFDSNLGPNLGQEMAYKQIEADYPSASYFINVDDDVIYSKHWLNEIQRARKQLAKIGLNGIISAMNMPLRPSFSTLKIDANTYLLKHRQPALNWIIPREIYSAAGPFQYDGVAYDTSYAQRLRLYNFPIVCLSPSYVQNIGISGAYACDARTTSADFVGEAAQIKQPPQMVLALTLRKYLLMSKLWLLMCGPYHWHGLLIDGPVRWGSEWVYEGRLLNGRAVAACPADDSRKIGWTDNQIEDRLREVSNIVKALPRFGLRSVNRSRKGEIVNFVYDWEFMPSIKDILSSGGGIHLEPTRIFVDLLRALIPFHKSNVVHNKIRMDNVFVDRSQGTVRLAWMGTEYPTGFFARGNKRESVFKFSNATDLKTSYTIRESHCRHYLECVAPEVLEGKVPTMSSDLYAAASLPFLASKGGATSAYDLYEGPSETLARLVASPEAKISALLRACTDVDPGKRPRSAIEALDALL